MDEKIGMKTSAGPDRLILPKEVWHAMGWGEKTTVEIWMNATQDEVVIKKHQHSCVFCGTTEALISYRKKYICRDCRRKITGT